MIKMQKGYLLKGKNRVVTDKLIIADVRDEDFEEVQIAIPVKQIKNWAEEIELMGLD
ncbi:MULTISPECIES: hypothetical protein [Bacillota]|uniref:hypothetical protein n=1 Tax=Bacillota TaxID=1239 RepID=UPI000A6FBA66|nr:MULTISPECIES: hypothetical protein [Bacillota]TWM14794.1 hypothetical protein CHCC15091_1835 [Bacillus licheniformis]GIN25456.1 hypothetical protein J31TS2_20360 [Bacillus licheniformis]GIN29805.1 hypothetical protein J2TS5_18440 [Bacillus licheniformis]